MPGKRHGMITEDNDAIQVSDEDQDLRAQAKALLKQIKFNDDNNIEVEIEPKRITQAIEDTRAERLTLLQEYADIIQRLELHDYKLAEAYQARRLYFEQGICLAEYKRRDGERSFTRIT